MANENMLNTRANDVLIAKDVSVNSFASASGMLQGTINPQFNGTKKISLQTILAILKVFPDVSAEWLLRGEGSMLRTADKQTVNNAYSTSGHANAGGTQIIGAAAEEVSALKKRIAELEKDKENMQKLIDRLG